MADYYSGSYLNIDGQFLYAGADQNQNLFLFWDMGSKYVMIADGAAISNCTNVEYSPVGTLSFSYAGGYYIGPVESMHYNSYSNGSTYITVLTVNTTDENFTCSPLQTIPALYDHIFNDDFN